MKKILIIFFFVTSCGYQPLYMNKNQNFFLKIELTGNKKIARQIVSLAALSENPNSKNKNIIILDVSDSTIATSKDTKGKITSYKTTLNVKVLIKENDKLLHEKFFDESFNYNNLDNKYDLSNYRKDVEENLARKIAEDLIIYINLL
tara:strand:+ start:1503 stop:1943 length:441 start_codon:yes stop_codon:yes gene_type:complete